MRFPATVVASILTVGTLLGAGMTEVRADPPGGGEPLAAAPDPEDRPAPRPGTDEEAREYERRESESPEVQEFVGGYHWVIGLLVIAALVLLIILLAREI